jgi:ribonuclease Z
MSIKLTILGCHSATPRVNSHTTSQFLEINNHNFLIDCGEGTQVQMRKFKVKFSKIEHIFISHLHGDHFFGLIGFIATLGLLNRKKPLHIYGPKGIKEIIVLQLKLSSSWTDFPLYFHELSKKESYVIFEDDKILVKTIPLKHRIYTNGYLFAEKEGERKLDMFQISKYPEIEICDYQNLKNGKDYICENGKIIPNTSLTTSPNKPLSYAFCSDTAYNPSIVPLIKDVDLLYHESTFLKDREYLCETTMHSTAEQAAKIAFQAKAKQLILGHFSSRYDDLNMFLDEAKPIFSNVYLAKEGCVFELQNKKNVLV